VPHRFGYCPTVLAARFNSFTRSLVHPFTAAGVSGSPLMPAALHDSADFRDWIRQHAEAQGFRLDPAQENAVEHFQRLYEDLIGLERLEAPFIRLLARKRVVRGLYLWGGVGRGKTFLMDSFYECAPVARKERIHFHRFMQGIHRELHRRQGQADPLAAIARDRAKEARLLCLDEFHITDITDAMMMKRLLESLFEQGVVVVTTSNFEPDALYLHGLQRSQFLAAIDLIKQNLEVVNVDTGTDYRLRELEKAGTYHVGPGADEALERTFTSIARHESHACGELEIDGRTIRARRHAPDVAWFDFDELCDGPRGKPDYIELACRYHTVLVSNVPRFRARNADTLRRFVWLVDEFYDRRVKLILSADVEPEQLVMSGEEDDGDRFQANLNASLNERLVSRLTEMQTRDYLAQPHLQ
jgi:cell division protein ZapE